MELNIALLNPQIPQNTGNIARTCAATGAKLHLIKPMGFTIDDKKMKRAGLDYWDKLSVKIYDSYDDFIEFANPNRCWFFETLSTSSSPKCYCDIEYKNGDFLVFGSEDKGIPRQILEKNLEQCVQIPMRFGLRSLNLSNTVAIGVYEALKQWGFPQLTT